MIKAVLSLAVKPGSFAVSYSGISYFLLLLLATTFAIRNGIQNTLESRPFWIFLAIAYGLWGLHQWLTLYYELGLRVAVPDNSIADTLLFLHVVPLMVALATLPHRKVSDRKRYQVILNASLLLVLWSFLYGYLVFPYQYLYSISNYGLRFDILYLLENLALVSAVGILSFRVETPWRSIYLHLLGASALYAVSSAVANVATDTGGYVSGKLYGLGMTASVCWFVWIPLRVRHVRAGEVPTLQSDDTEPSLSAWPMLAVLMISIPIVWELFQRNEDPGLRSLRLVVAIAAFVCIASAAHVKEYLARRELTSHLDLATDQLRLAMQAGTCVGWELDIKNGQDVWFGDLQTIFGIPSDMHVASMEEFIHYVHPDDRQRVVQGLADARQNLRPYEQEFRILRPDGTIRWLAGRGKFYFSANGDPERMVGVSQDITERKRAEEALSRASYRVIEAEEREFNRLAVDLHENIGQRLALLAISIEQLKSDLSEEHLAFRDRMDVIWMQTMEILADVKASAHELYSPRLEYLAFPKVVKSFCKEFGERQKVEIKFTEHDTPSSVLPDVSICLFRVLQEALHNAIKHSGAHELEVQLWGTKDGIHLMVSDNGVGFEIESARSGQGLGLSTIEERMKLVKGTFSVESKPGVGTKIYVHVPPDATKVLRAAG